MDIRTHWNDIYGRKRPEQLTWYQPHLATSLDLITSLAPDTAASIIDVGAGEATLVDDLLQRGYSDLTVLDVSPAALEVAKSRLGPNADKVHWICADVTSCALPERRFDVWHDRAVFHFLTEASARQAYVRQVRSAVKPGGYVVVATFGPEGPVKCSGLDVVRYGPDALHDAFGPSFQMLGHRTEKHTTPTGGSQQFVYCYCRLSSELPEQ